MTYFVNPTDDPLKFGFMECRKAVTSRAVRMNLPFEVDTMEGLMRGKKGDYLMCGIEGEYYPCDREIFEKTYEFTGNEG
jgi:hypothetical protein